MHRSLSLLLLWISCATLFGHGDLHEQIASISKQIESGERTAALFIRRGELHRLHRQWDAALSDFDAAQRLDPVHRMLDLCRGRTFLDSGRPKAARDALDRFIEREPKHVEGLVCRARAHAGLKEFTAAVDDLDAAAALAPRSAEIHFERARVLAATGDSSERRRAIQGLDAALKSLGPLITLEELAVELELEENRFDDALRRIDGILKGVSRKETWLARKADVLDRAGRAAEAIAVRREALDAIARLPGTHSKARSMLALEKRIRAQLTQTTPHPITP